MQIMQGKAQEAVGSAFMVYELTAEPALPGGEVTCKGSTSEERRAKSDNEDGDGPSGTNNSGVGGSGSDAVEEQEGSSDDDLDALMLQEGSQQGDQHSLLEREAALRRRLVGSRRADKLETTKNMILWCLEEFGDNARKHKDWATHSVLYGVLCEKMEYVSGNFGELFDEALSELRESNLIWCNKQHWYLLRTDSESGEGDSSMHDEGSAQGRVRDPDSSLPLMAADGGKAQSSDCHVHDAGSAQDRVQGPASSLPCMAAAQVMSLDQTTLNFLCCWIKNPRTAGTNYHVLKHTVGKDIELPEEYTAYFHAGCKRDCVKEDGIWKRSKECIRGEGNGGTQGVCNSRVLVIREVMKFLLKDLRTGSQSPAWARRASTPCICLLFVMDAQGTVDEGCLRLCMEKPNAMEFVQHDGLSVVTYLMGLSHSTKYHSTCDPAALARVLLATVTNYTLVVYHASF